MAADNKLQSWTRAGNGKERSRFTYHGNAWTHFLLRKYVDRWFSWYWPLL